MKKRLLPVILGMLLFSSICYAHDVIEIGGTLVYNPIIFNEGEVGGGINIAVFSEIYKSFGLGVFLNFARGANDMGTLDFLLGPYYAFSITEKLSLPVSFGVYAGIMYLGYGGNITLQYAFHKNFSVFARFQCVYAYFTAPGVKTAESIVMSPCIGIGFRF